MRIFVISALTASLERLYRAIGNTSPVLLSAFQYEQQNFEECVARLHQCSLVVFDCDEPGPTEFFLLGQAFALDIPVLVFSDGVHVLSLQRFYEPLVGFVLGVPELQNAIRALYKASSSQEDFLSECAAIHTRYMRHGSTAGNTN